MTSVGTHLRSAREDQQRNLAEIANELCITQRYLRALEEDDLKSLPGVFFYKSFVRQYAAILNVDMRVLTPGIEALCPAPVEKSEHAQPERAAQPIRTPEPLLQDFNRYISDQRVGMSAAGLVVVVLICSGFYSWWTKAPAPKPEPQVVAARATDPVLPVADTRPMNHAELNLSATQTTWLSITANGKEIFSGVLQPSQTKTLTDVEGAHIRLGNAGGVEVRWKGKPIGPFGQSGEVTTVQLTEDNFKVITPEEKAGDEPTL